MSAQVALNNLTDGQWHNVDVHWNAATQTFTYTFGGVQVGQLQLTPAQFASYFGGSNYAYFGFTGSTGGLSALHQIQLNSLNATFETGSPPGTPHPHDGSIFDVTTIDQHVTVNGSASDEAATHTFTLTPDAQSQAGSVTFNDKVDLTHDFNIAFDFISARSKRPTAWRLCFTTIPMGPPRSAVPAAVSAPWACRTV